MQENGRTWSLSCDKNQANPEKKIKLFFASRVTQLGPHRNIFLYLKREESLRESRFFLNNKFLYKFFSFSFTAKKNKKTEFKII